MCLFSKEEDFGKIKSLYFFNIESLKAQTYNNQASVLPYAAITGKTRSESSQISTNVFADSDHHLLTLKSEIFSEIARNEFISFQFLVPALLIDKKRHLFSTIPNE